MVALHFALIEAQPVVWAINPFELSRLIVPGAPDELGLTWHRPEGAINVASENINCAWENGRGRVERAAAIPPTNVHPRVHAQRSCFTVHGTDPRSLVDQCPSLLTCYEFELGQKAVMRRELHLLGVGFSTVRPDLDGLAAELAQLY